MPNYGGESSGPSDLGGGNYTGGGGNSNDGGGGGILGVRPLIRFSQPPAAAYTDVLGAVSDGGRGRNPTLGGAGAPQAPQPPALSPLQQNAIKQAQLDTGNNQWGQYQAPQMNPMPMYGGGQANPFMSAFPWGQFFNTFGGK